MALSLFARRPAAVDPAAWTPPGTRVVQRYRNALGIHEGAVVLVYTADGGPGPGRSHFAAACLGCTFRAVALNSRTWLTENEAADIANGHAAGCRAMNRSIPAAPDDTQAARIVRNRLCALRPYGTSSPEYVALSDFLEDRVDLQRPDGFIEQVMLQLTQSEPDFLTSVPTYGGTGTRFLAQPYPRQN
jgi:hypothetical protein